MSPWWGHLAGALGEGLLLCAEIALVVLPLMILYELADAYGWFARPRPRLARLLRGLGLGPYSLVPLLSGFFLGLFYGAGILLGVSREKGLPMGERLALGVFLVTCHAVVEDTAIFVVLGGSALAILGPRLILAVGLTSWLARRLRKKPLAKGNES
ncbi:MAG: nucleoside recognition protein [Deltaproteobacteria bacterium]|nr:nucleoside recognition protein [Deltaproteobacteria bacterium]